MTLVVGATGMVGMEVCRLLASAGKPVRALVRPTSDPTKVETLKKLGAAVVVGDLRDGASLKSACAGVNAIIATASAIPSAYQPGENTPQTDQDGYLSLISSAREAGIQGFVYTSFHPFGPSFPLQDAKRAVENSLRKSGISYTILQPTYFMEVWLSPAVGFDYANHKAVIYGAGDSPISWISFLDVAQFAVMSLTTPAARNASLELGGPAGIRPTEVVKIFERAGGKPFEVTHVPVEGLQAQFAAASDPMQKSFVGLMLSHSGTKPIDMTSTLRAFPVKLKTVEEHAHTVMA